MTAFHVSAAAMLGLALLFVLPALLRSGNATALSARQVQRDDLNLDVLRDQLRELDADLQAGTIDATAYQSARLELERRVAQEVQLAPSHAASGPVQKGTALAVAVSVGLIAALAYQAVGDPRALDPAERVAQAPGPHASGAPPMSAAQVEGMVASLAEKLKSKPDDAKGWRMLARSYETLRRFDQAVDAYQHLLKLTPNDSAVMVDYAVTLAMQSGQSLAGEPEKIIKQALAIDPDNLQALALAGSAAFERHDYAKAIQPWRRILAQAPPDSEIARSIETSIEKAETLQAGQSAGHKSAP